MEYIAYLHKEANADFGVSFPDFPGCVTAGRTLDEARKLAPKALALHIRGMIEDGEKVPTASSLDDVASDPDRQGAVAFLVTVEVSDLTARHAQEATAISETNLLIYKLQQTFPNGPPKGEEGGGWLISPLDVLDCVLSLSRNYDTFCLPRVERFKKMRPEVDTLEALRHLIESYATPLEFSIQELNYRDEARAATLDGVLAYLLRAQSGFDGPSEATRLRQWAESVKPSDYESVGVRGFGLSGFQYLRILFGAQTVKPDIHICSFVSEAVGRRVGDIQALTLLEAAGEQLGWPLAELDYAVWERKARPSV